MQLQTIPFAKTHAFSSLFLDYTHQMAHLSDFYHLFPTLAAFKTQIQQKQTFFKGSVWRDSLAAALTAQYQGMENAPIQQINSLREENTFTVTTGHQLNIFTGPLYFIYKIITCIRLAQSLKEKYSGYNFVPIYWMASEDHDFEEINHFHLFGKRYEWKTTQTGAVGKFDTLGFEEIFEQIKELPEMFKGAYNAKHTLSEATRYLVHQLFKDTNLVCIDADDATLKQGFKSYIETDIFEHHANQQINQYSEKLASLGYKTQIYPREINFFYLENGIRERIVAEEGTFKVLNTALEFDEATLRQLIAKHPERFSPNVAMRPLYQEVILPNLAYIGGPGELAYWLQLKGVFEHYEVPFPVLMPRNFAMIVNKNNHQKLAKLGLDYEAIFQDLPTLKKQWLLKNATTEISLEEEKKQLWTVFEAIKQKALQADKTLEGFVGAEYNKLLKSVENIEKRLKKSEEQKSNTQIQQLENLKEKLFPYGSLQERKENILSFMINEPDFIDKISARFDPFCLEMYIFAEVLT